MSHQGPLPCPPRKGVLEVQEDVGHRVTRAHVCSACQVFAGFYTSTDVCMFLINQGRREGEFVQRDKICRQNVWEAGHKKQAVMLSTNSHEQA